MLKFIHCADIHLGSTMDSSLPKEKAAERRGELLATFHRMVEYAVRENVAAILISGDLFDSDRPVKRDKEYFYSAVKNNPQVDFLYLRGNHDSLQSYTETLPNLKTFSERWTKYSYGDVDIYGTEFTDGNALTLYSALKPVPSRVNLVMLHGQTADSAGKDKICLPKLRDRNIDYLALGHIHSYAEGKLDSRGRYCYSGCLEGRGFDETGEKGFVLLTIDGGVKSEFVPFAKRTVVEYTVDLTGTESVYEGVVLAKKAVIGRTSDLVRLRLTGEIECSEGLVSAVKNALSDVCYFASVKDGTTEKIDPELYRNATSLSGEFVRGVMADERYDEVYRKRMIALGLRALTGREIDV